MSLTGAPLNYVFNSGSPFIEDYIPPQQPTMDGNTQGMYFDQQSLSDDLKMPMMKKKEMTGNSGEIEHFRGGGGGGHSGGGFHGGSMGGFHGSGMGGSMNHGSGYNRPHGSGYNRPHSYGHQGHHGNRPGRWNNGRWIPYAGAIAGGYAMGNYWDGQNYIQDDGYYYDQPPVIQNIYLDDNEPKEESSVKIESLSSEESSKKKKKLKKLKKVKEENEEDKNNKKELSKKTLWGIIVFLIILVLILGFKLLVDYKMIRF